jgi:hypothetical protein
MRSHILRSKEESSNFLPVVFTLIMFLCLLGFVADAYAKETPPLGTHGGILHTCQFPERPAKATATQEKVEALEFPTAPLEKANALAYPPYPLEDTFLLHSYPSSDQKLLIDLDGFDGFNGLSTPYDTDGDPDTFSEIERLEIQKIWYCVAEHFLPFNIDVTTEDEGISPIVGQRAVVDGSARWTYSFAYFGDWARETTREAYVSFYGGAWNWIAPTISHEVGHTLDLSHDGGPGAEYYGGHGTFDTQWCPVMGWGGDSMNVWSIGDYYGSTNTEDDLAMIDAVLGVDYRPDDHGSTTGTATAITFTAASLELAGEGIVERNDDVDYFSFTTAVDGNVQFSINEDILIGATNLDVLAKIHDSGGTVLYTSNPIDRLWATFDVTLAAGNYYLSIDGTGMGDPMTDPPSGYSDYGALGYYSIFALGSANNDPDVTAPTPNPMTWETVPYKTGAHSIAMEASVATDTENGVEYNFICTAGGGNDSGWQPGTSYTDTSLPAGILYTYTVTARDTSDNRNPGAASSSASATTDPESAPPSPDPMTWSTAPNARSSSMISMTATKAFDPSGVEYFFDCTIGAGHDSDWQDSSFYADTGLLPNTSYTYTVTVRDKSSNQNTTATSTALLATTLTTPAGAWIGTDKDVYAQYEDFTVYFANTGGNLYDWIGLFADGATNEDYIKYVYLYGETDGTMIYGGISDSGDYDIRLFFNDSYTVEASCDISVAGLSAPTPDPMTFATAPYATSGTSITMVATTATGSFGVEYYFTCTAGGGNDSDWQSSTSYTDTTLTPGTLYTYTVTARDQSPAQNSTAPSGGASAVTCSTCGDIDGSGGDVDLADFAELAGCWSENPSTNPDCTCANLVEDSDDIIDLLDLQVFAELFLSSSSDYPPDCSP